MLKVERLTKTYATATGPLTVLKDVSFGVEAGATVAIVGPSGSGKTTLLGLCAGLDRPTSGTVELAGAGLGRLTEDERALVRNASVGFVFQTFQLIPTLTALENVLVPVELRTAPAGFSEKSPASRLLQRFARMRREPRAVASMEPRAGNHDGEADARELLARVGLAGRLDHYPVQLSGGEQQRVSLARAFINRPKILFCDEPTGNLDDETAGAMVDLIFGLNRERGTTLVLVTHNLELAARCGRVIRLRGGVVVGDAKG